MAAETGAFAELGELIYSILTVTILGFFFFIAHNPNLLYSEVHTTEAAAIASILPKDTTVTIEYEKEISIETFEENTFLIAVEGEFIEEEKKLLPNSVSIEQEQNTIIITNN